MKQYFTPMLLSGSGNIGITDSQEGSIGTGTVPTDINSFLAELGLTPDLYSYYNLPDNISEWYKVVPGFNPNDPDTFDLLSAYLDTV